MYDLHCNRKPKNGMIAIYGRKVPLRNLTKGEAQALMYVSLVYCGSRC